MQYLDLIKKFIFFLVKCGTVLRYTLKCNFMYVNEKIRAVALPIFFVESHKRSTYVLISYAEFHQTGHKMWKI
jgi:hypothetical protein